MEAILTQCAMAKAATPVSGSYKKTMKAMSYGSLRQG